ncbi:MAG: hydroxysqualene dehydroxylase HpnE [Xanthobacteraceae bacterium]|nr:hydroxysqualene dehydroxylase HpnE [Xanthobacteraceae bacterium]
MARTVHIVGAGLAGLSAAIELTLRGEAIAVHEATTFAGGRCRSYHDQILGMTIDNGNHLLLSGNHAAQRYVKLLGAEARLVGPPRAEFPFLDLANKEQWTLRINDGRIPWWIFNSGKRVPGTRALDYLPMARLLWAQKDRAVGEVVRFTGPLYERLMRPLLLAALNIEPSAGSAALAGAIIRETLVLGGQACRPLVAREGLGSALIEPALALLRERGRPVRMGHQLHRLHSSGTRVEALDFGADKIALESDDVVILAVPPYAASALVADLKVPTEFRAIVNAHFRIEPAPDQPAILGLINSTTEWVFAFPGRVATTISAGDRLIETPRDALARTIWSEVSAATGLPPDLPPWQIVRERRATFAATPEQDALRPGPQTRFTNVLLAGDWTNTGLPATIESAIRSGRRAADLVA